MEIAANKLEPDELRAKIEALDWHYKKDITPKGDRHRLTVRPMSEGETQDIIDICFTLDMPVLAAKDYDEFEFNVESQIRELIDNGAQFEGMHNFLGGPSR